MIKATKKPLDYVLYENLGIIEKGIFLYFNKVFNTLSQMNGLELKKVILF